MKNKSKQISLNTLVLLIYAIFIAYITLYDRKPYLTAMNLDLFWSYRSWFNGESTTGVQILQNIAMFIPFGVISMSFFDALLGEKKSARIKCLGLTALIGLALSLVVEFCQYWYGLGLFELDDLFNNTLGCLLGGLFWILAMNICSKKNWPKDLAISCIGVAMLLVGLAGCIYSTDTAKEVGNTSKLNMVFQIDSISWEEGNVSVDGFCFGYDDYPEDKDDINVNTIKQSEIDFTGSRLLLIDCETDKKYELETTWNLGSENLNNYYGGEYDYSNEGFVAKSEAELDESAEYKVVIECRNIQFDTRSYIQGEELRAVAPELRSEPDVSGTDLEEIVSEGRLVVCRQDEGCWVYQYGDELYWIAGDDFYFEDDGSTYIQYQMWTTQFWNLPEERLENDWYWSNIGGNFEDYEITGEMDYGEYRVMKREIPSEYSVCEIVTGYYANERWIWREYFTPRIVG